MSVISLSKIVEAVKLGANLQDLIPPGSDLAYWQRLVDRQLAGEAKPKRKAGKRNAGGRKAGKRTFQASSVLTQVGQAMAEQVERVNSGATEARVILVGRAW